MINMRPLLLSLPLLLTGCSTLSSWSPFNWFSSAPQVTATGLGEINAATPMRQEALEKALDGDYRLRSGMETSNGQIIAFYQALTGDQIKLIIFGEPRRTVSQVEVMDQKIESEWGVRIGTPFSDVYSKAFGFCRQGQGEDAEGVECSAPQSRQVSYIFSGEWHGPAGLLPSDDVLKSWTVSKIVWRARAD